jgi:biotin transporter BioY
MTATFRYLKPTLSQSRCSAGSGRLSAVAAWFCWLSPARCCCGCPPRSQVPFWPVPMTMQTVRGAWVIGAAFGWRLGMATVALYLLEGALGLPVFTQAPRKRASALPTWPARPAAIWPAFVLAAGVTGWLAETRLSTATC